MNFRQFFKIDALLILFFIWTFVPLSLPAWENNLEVVRYRTTVKNGIDNLEYNLSFFKDKRVGLITNQTGITSSFVSSIDILKEKTDLKVLFSPEYGVRDSVGAGKNAASYVDKQTALPVYCLCKNGLSTEPSADMFKDIDVLVYDVQDMGVRYCNISTVLYAMKACKKYNKTFIVLDRPAPLSGSVIEGGMLQADYISFLGVCPVPIRFGLTIGELARYLNDKMNLKCDLMIVPMSGWVRNMYWSDTDLRWISPIMNISMPDAALAYAGIYLLEGTNLSVGRGTVHAFMQIGAPWIKDPEKLAESLNKLGLSGVRFSYTYFSPMSDKYSEEFCGGVELQITNKSTFRPVAAAVYMIFTIRELYKDNFEFRKSKNGKYWIDYLSGSSLLRKSAEPEDVIKAWNEQSAAFEKETAKYRIYKE